MKKFQQHGCVYSVIPAKRVKFPPLGEWNTEEIPVIGGNIKVIVNGEVILDGNVREACQGNPIIPDGSYINPYIMDKRNHPGFFNKSGHIGFLGYSAGVKSVKLV